MTYDTLAPVYETLETFTLGRALQWARCAALETWQGHPPESVLVLGDGDGRFLEQAFRAWPETVFVCIEQSERMQALAKQRILAVARSSPSDGHAMVTECLLSQSHSMGTPGDQFQFIHGEVREGLASLGEAEFEVIVSHFFLDCFTDGSLQRLIPDIAARLRQGGHWYISEFTDRTWWQRCLLWGMYRFFRLTTETEAGTFPNYAEILNEQGLRANRLGSWRGNFVVADHFQRSSP